MVASRLWSPISSPTLLTLKGSVPTVLVGAQKIVGFFPCRQSMASVFPEKLRLVLALVDEDFAPDSHPCTTRFAFWTASNWLYPTVVVWGEKPELEDNNLENSDNDPSPFYRAHVFCCVNVRPKGHPRGCCSERGSLELRAHMKARAKELGLSDVRINASQCLDRCELGPTVVIYPEGVWYRCQTKQDIDEVLQTHLVEGSRVRRLMLMPEE